MSKDHNISFDNSLPSIVAGVRTLFGDASLQRGVFLRDASGRLSFVADEERRNQEERSEASDLLRSFVGGYARADRLIIYRDDPGAKALLEDPSRFFVEVEGTICQLLDRRIVGTGWLDQPRENAPGPPRVVFASLKGGVGRSTAIAIAAADLARRNKNVLVVDLDLEAPGLGALLLEDLRVPLFGTVDFLVENGIGGVADSMLGDFMGTSSLTTGEGGRVDVVPAFGLSSRLNSENVLPKLARAMIEDLSESGETISVGEQIGIMLERLTSLNSYDVVLIDSRAGLAELAAPAVLGLGATVLLFGTAQNQTIQGYRGLFAALRLLALRDRVAGRKAEWRLMFKAVYAKATFDENLTARYADELYDLFADYLYDAQEDDGLNDDDVSFVIEDPNSPHWPLIIPFNSSFLDFDPVRAPNQLSLAFYEQTFRPFLDGLDLAISSSSSSL